jgi:hypothetical protein
MLRITLLERDLAAYQKLADKYPEGLAILTGASGRKDPQAGTQGSKKDTTSQQDRKTPGSYGVDDD